MPFDSDIPTPPLVSILYRNQNKFLNNKLKDVDLSSGLYTLLIKSYKNEGISQEELASSIHLIESPITRNLGKLEKKGLITKTPEKRKKIISVTDKGAEIAQKIMDYDDGWDETIKKSLTESEYDDFKKLLKKICEDLI